MQAAVDRFGRIDVLVNNAANFYGGYFEELTPEQIERQLATALIGPMNVTRAVLPVMRKQRAGHIISISSGAGLSGFEFNSAYAAAKFGLEGWMESLAARGRPVRHPHHHRQSGLVPHRAAHARSRPPTPSRPSRTTPSAAPPGGKGMRPRTGARPATRPSSRRRCSRSPASSPRRAALSPAPMPSPSPSRRWPISRRRSTPIATCRRRLPWRRYNHACCYL